MPNTLQSLRRTGRTTRMVEAAAEWVAFGHGHALIVVEDDVTDIGLLANMMLQAELDGRSQQFGLSVIRYDPREVDLRAMRHRRYSDCKLFVDHHVLDHEFGRILELYHAYDPPIHVAGSVPPTPPPTPSTGTVGTGKRRILFPTTP
jgi:hypothetical protein